MGWVRQSALRRLLDSSKQFKGHKEQLSILPAMQWKAGDPRFTSSTAEVMILTGASAENSLSWADEKCQCCFLFSAGWIANHLCPDILEVCCHGVTASFCGGSLGNCFFCGDLREGRRNWKLKQGYCGLEQAEVLGDPGIASLDLSGLFTSTGCCSNWRREIASSGYVVGFGKGFSTAFVMFKGGCCSQIKLE